MKQTLKQRIIPEVDERETERESQKVASYVEESLKEIAPIDGDSSLFNTDDLFDDLEEMQDMTDEFFGEGFSVPGSGGFGGDMLFEGGPTETGGKTEKEQLESLRDLEEMFGNMGGMGAGMVEPLMGMHDMLGENAAKSGAIAKTLGGMSKLFKGGAATILLGGVGLAILGGLWSTVKSMAKHSPLLGSVVEMLGMVTTFLIRPFAHMIGQMLLPIMMDLLQISAKFMSISFEKGIMNGMIYLGKTFLDAIFSLPGLLAIGITAAGGAIGAALGGAAAAKIGGTIGAILGSVVPGIGTTVGAALGATIGVTLAGILGVLTAYNLGGIKKFFADMTDGIDLMKWTMYAILGPFGIVAMEFFKWMKKNFKKTLKLWENIKDEGFFKAVFDISKPIIKEKQIIDFLKNVIPKFTLWDEIKAVFPGWPNINWSGWGSFIPEIDWDLSDFPGWGSFIPTIESWNLPEIPSSQDILDALTGEADVPDETSSPEESEPSGGSGDYEGSGRQDERPRIDDGGDDDSGGSGGDDDYSGGGSGGGCFVAGTLVETPSGLVPIEEISPDDVVISFDEDSQTLTSSVVGEQIIHSDDHDYERYPLLEVTLNHGDGVTSTQVTANHRYLTEHNGWEQIGDVSVGQMVKTQFGFAIVESKVEMEDPDRIYNLHMKEGPHNYLVDNAVVHNYKTYGLASGGIVSDTLLTYVGEGRESEVVAPLSKFDNMVQKRASNQAVKMSSSSDSGGIGGGDDDNTDVDDQEIIRQLKKTNRLLRSLPDDIELELNIDDASKWEVDR